jgi:putative nucleotidyltransferase with HDIG domain
MNAVSETDSTKCEKPKVLVVDDEHDVADILGEGLQFFGYETEVVYSGVDALARLHECRFDALLSDVHMPRMGGDDLQHTARSLWPDLAVILVTAATDLSLAVKCFQDGISDFIAKPFDLTDVAARIERALERQRLIRENRSYQATLEMRVAEQAAQIRSMFEESLQALNRALEAKDGYTRDHSDRVASAAYAIARRLKPDDETFADKLRTAALFHDIGKIGVPSSILTKAGKLTDDEWACIKKHPEIGESILKPIFRDPIMLAVVRNHHERYDGGGYPDGLVGEEIALEARIAAVADAFDAMTSARSYRDAMPRSKALRILSEGRGTQWDPACIDAFFEIVDSFEPAAPRYSTSAEIEEEFGRAA